jgi:hypothetical protein
VADYDERLADYVDVAARLAELRRHYPAASLAPVDPAEPFRVVEVGPLIFVAYTAVCSRWPGDPSPGIGCAWEPFPGRTPYTKDSELQNAETSAWGRAIVAALAADSHAGVASRDELAARRADLCQQEPTTSSSSNGAGETPARSPARSSTRGRSSAPAKSQRARSAPKVTSESLSARLAQLTDEQRAAFVEWHAESNMPAPGDASSGVLAAMARKVDEIEAAGQ